ncbi:MAG TPA: transporter substrate-binding domain-containing protein [Candidatus Aphodovivens avicola]|nr:transporter substrate-binding domain-containing protein [Candidatus Aphodovivens avicola]
MKALARKRIWALAAAAAMLALAAALMAGCSGGSNESQSAGGDEAASAESGEFTLTVGFDQGYPPYGFVGDDGEYTGFDLDLAAEVAERNGWNLELSAIDWDAKDALLSSGSINCIWNGFTMEGREDDYTFSEPYMLNEQVIVVKSDSGIADSAALAGKTVMTQVDSAALDVLEGDAADLAATFAGGAPQTISDYNNAFMQLESGMVDAVACDLSIANYQMSAKPDTYTIIDTLSSEHYAVGFKQGDEDLAATVTATLKAMYEDGTVQELCDKYAEYGLSFDNWVLK